MSIIGQPITLGGKASGPVARSDVNFFDYDGSIVASYTAADFANLSAMPKNPTHDGLTAQGWNWTLADAKAYVASYGKLDVGQMYITDDGKTRIYIKLEEGRLAPYLGIAINGTATVEWGDGQTSTVTGSSVVTIINTQHTYASAGEYVIKIAVNDGRLGITGNSNGSTLLWKNSSSMNDNRVYQNAVQKIEVGAHTVIYTHAFDCCYSLTSVVLPSSSMLGFAPQTFQSCFSLKFVVIPTKAYSMGSTALQGCYSITHVIIPYDISNLAGFRMCTSLVSVVIPSSVTSIDESTFYGCYSLVSVVIPSSVTSINAQAFRDCCGLSFIKFAGTTPPNVANANAWNRVPTDCIIYVPRGSLSAYTSAANYPSSSTYTYVEYDP